MTLLIDIGNSRIKWARVTRGRRGPQHSEPLRGAGLASFRRLVASLQSDARVLAVNVAGAPVERALRAAVRAAGLAAPRLLRTAAAGAAGGSPLVNGYSDTWRLGADRWAAMLGARQVTAGRWPLCVVDVGTALTIDFIDSAGRHRGGYITPGPELAVRALLAGTRGIRRRASGDASGDASGRGRPADRPWPRATLPAIERGSLEACAGAIQRSHAAARQQFGATTRLLLTGGAAPALLDLLPAGVRHFPDLVLEGLQAWDGC